MCTNKHAAFMEGFLEKVAWRKSGMRREIKEIAKGVLSGKAIKRIVGNNRSMKHERFIKSIGSGSSQQADLVMHPRYGISVRKHYRDPYIDLNKLKKHDDVKILKFIKSYQATHGPSGFAKVFGVDPKTSLSYHEYIPGESLLGVNMKSKKKTMSLLDDVRHRYDRPSIQKATGDKNTIVDMARQGSRAERLWRLLWNKQVARTIPDAKLSAPQQKLVRHIKERFPGAYDYNAPQNIIKRKGGRDTIIDISPDVINDISSNALLGKFQQFKIRR